MKEEEEMISITEMGLEDYHVSRIIRDYRRMVKACNSLGDYCYLPLLDLICFIEDLFPAFAAAHADGEVTDDYWSLEQIVMSDMDDEKVEKILLGKRSADKDGLEEFPFPDIMKTEDS